MERIEVEEIVCKIKGVIRQLLEKRQYEMVLKMVSVCASILYDTNVYYMDSDLERVLQQIAKILLPDETCMNNIPATDAETVLFYDGFGLDNRGLAKIYLKALGQQKKICYVTYKGREQRIPEILNIIHSCGGKVYYLETGKRINQINQLNGILKESNAGHFFFYGYPDDVVATTFLYACEGLVKRYQINLTDHAFWLGAHCIDLCIEFREYGASISREYRKIPQNKIVLLPFYPDINRDQPFLGYPFAVTPDSKVIFSGGSLYKTLGKGNKYYEIVDYLLSTHKQAVFWYAGTGDDTLMQKLMDKYPGRLFLTPERKDLFQLLQNCYFYLSTYPISGGMMFQYAACAGKVPLTLRSSDDDDGLLLNQEQLGIVFDSMETLKSEIDRLMEDEEYALEKSATMMDSVISEEHFCEELFQILELGFSDYKFTYKVIDVEGFQQTYLERICSNQLNECFVGKNCVGGMLRYFPVYFLAGFWSKASRKLRTKLHIR